MFYFLHQFISKLHNTKITNHCSGSAYYFVGEKIKQFKAILLQEEFALEKDHNSVPTLFTPN